MQRVSPISAMKVPTDRALKPAVQAELSWSPDLDASGIEIHVEHSAVTASGVVGSYAELLAVGRAMTRVRGVTSAINKVMVQAENSRWVTDADIRRIVDHALTWSTTVPRTVRSRVLNRHVTLTGEVDWDFQRRAAHRAVQDLRGVESVENLIHLTTRTPVENAEQQLRDAMERHPQLDAGRITATVIDHTAVLTGYVSSLAASEQAGSATWGCPSVTQVDNRLVVRPS
ncbi:BON domain-containing protein [Nesterenkonia sp. E16_7]|uniref:BON domain-containing protein n=1 Tax=unclassified Nesterenkonia TaxID=2629769 RepID=UPI001A917DE2|nr:MULTISPECIES: BON domain-containing protein [unclassified Nesterenkonia]MBO0595935.1 BON domain-containing protein [Nesterenkonia sp. E16_10]MBO0599465.1 BON domain-containing protein [Nesterenkonia sp. E16_7]